MFFSSIMQTPFGPVTVTYTGEGHAHVISGGGYGEGEFVCSHKAPLYLSMHVYETDGEYRLGELSLHILRPPTRGRVYPQASQTAKKKVAEALPGLVTKHLKKYKTELAAEDVENAKRLLAFSLKRAKEMEAEFDSINADIAKFESIIEAADPG